jgi:hypothetical protein
VQAKEVKNGTPIRLNERLRQAYGCENGQIMAWKGDPVCQRVAIRLANGINTYASIKEIEKA